MAGRGIVIQISADPSTTKAALEQIREQMRETANAAEHESSRMAEGFERAVGALETVGLYMGIREAIDGVKELVGGSLELGESLVQTSKKTGLAVETLSVLHYASGILGSDFDGLATAVGRLDKMIGQAADGNSKAGAMMKALGLDAKDLAGRSDGAEIAFHRFVDTLAATESPIRRAQLAQQLLGKAGAAQIPILVEVSEHWEEFKQKAQEAGVVLNAETAEKLADTSQRLNDLKQRVTGAGLSFTEGLSPALSGVFSIIAGGKGSMDVMQEWGRDVGKLIAGVALVAYSTAGALELLFGVAEGGKFTEAGRRDLAAFEELKKKAEEFHKLTFEDAPEPKPFVGKGIGDSHVSGFEGAEGKGKKGGKDKGDNAIATAAAALVQEQAKAAADAQKSADEIQIAELEAQHRMQLLTDQEFYAEKLRLQLDALSGEEKALRDKQAALQALEKRQHGDKKLTRNKDGQSAEELKTERELLQVEEQIAALQTRRGQITSANTAEVNTANQNAELANLRAAAELEKQRNDGITAQIALLERVRELEAQKITREGGTEEAANEVRALGQVEAQKLRIGEVERQIAETEAGYRLKTDAIDDRARKGQESKLAAERQLNQLHQQEAATLQTLIEKYDALAATLGGEFKQKAAELHAELDKLNTPDKKQEADFGKVITKGVTSMAESIAQSTLRGKTSFRDMVKQMELDAAKLILKLIEVKLASQFGAGDDGGAGAASGGGGGGLGGIFASVFGALAEHHLSGGVGSGGPQVVGEAGPEIWTPPQRGGSYTPNNMLAKVAESGGGGGRAPNVTTNVINQSRQPVSAQPSEVSYDSQMREFVIHTVLTDHAQGGPIAQSMAGMR